MLRALITLIFFLPSLAIAAVPATEAGRALAEKIDAKYEGWQDLSATATMTLRNRSGDESIRKLRVQGLEANEVIGSRGLLVFDKPRDVRGVAFLTATDPGEDQQQWLYLPAAKRVKRIAAKTRSGSFMSSEFSYEDLGSQELENFHYALLGEEKYDGADCYLLERRPKDNYSGYTRHVVWVDKDELRFRKIEYFDRKNILLKTLTASNFVLHKDKFWRANLLEMINHQTKKTTTLEWSDISYTQGLSADGFTKAALKRIR